MVQLKCSMCGYEYESVHDLAPCPKCRGVGRIDPRCTCVYTRSFIGVMSNLMKKNQNCPIHKNGSNVEK